MFVVVVVYCVGNYVVCWVVGGEEFLIVCVGGRFGFLCGVDCLCCVVGVEVGDVLV